MQPDPDDLYDRLRAEGLFAESDGDLIVTDAFAAARADASDRVDSLDDDAREDLLADYANEERVPREDLASSPDLLADAVAVFETTETLDRPTSVLVAQSIRRSEAAADEPVPSGFLSLSAEEIEPFIEQHAASVLYFWRDDCEPCESVKRDFETVLDRNRIPESVGFAAVYGPDYVDTLREEYEVGAAPTILFCAGGEIDSRYVGTPGVDALETELSVLLDEAGV
ncbi:thioredoxin family protein [Halobellus rubicundus]|uniref:Thioredoxin family protein n=1 Tax=Halobellus rubicundus TaxID=2996466 RepID=A0ABD5MCL4_9EURY